MKLLCIDTSSVRGCLSVVDYETSTKSQEVIYENSWQKKSSHSEIANVVLGEALQKVPLKEIDQFLVGIGPGSFTGIRVSINLVKSLAYSVDKPVLPVNSLLLTASNGLKDHEKVLCAVNAFKNMMYVAAYQKADNEVRETISPRAVTSEQLSELISEPHLCLGDGFEIYNSQFSESLLNNLILKKSIENYPSLQNLGLVFSELDQRDKLKSWKSLHPLYIRASEAEEKLHRGILKPIPQLDK